MVELWKAQRRDKSKRGQRLAPILPVLFYSGTERWEGPLTLDAVMDIPSALSGFVPRHDTLCLRLREMPAQALCGSPLAWVLRVLQIEDAPLEELTRILSQAGANVDESLAHDEVEWRRLVQYLILLIMNRRQATERDGLFNALRESLTSHHHEEVEEMIYSSAQQWKDEGRQEGRQEGEKTGEIKTLLAVMECRFGPIPEQVRQALKALPPERLADLPRQILLVKSLDELHLD